MKAKIVFDIKLSIVMNIYFLDEFEVQSLLKLMISAQAKLCPLAR